MNKKCRCVLVTYMNLKSAAGLIIALVAVSSIAPSIALIGHKDKGLPTISPSFPLEMSNLSAEEINRRTLHLAATIKPSAK